MVDPYHPRQSAAKTSIAAWLWRTTA